MLVVVIMLGMVDSIEGGWVSAEVTNPVGNVEYVDFPVELFPCIIAEGDMFYAQKINGVTEFRCGEPPD